ncbi:MAG: hypothetical protein HYR67_12990 [Bacteroidetes bacterium]|nr:hypothetical protein [Bacteroidota bacterium]
MNKLLLIGFLLTSLLSCRESKNASTIKHEPYQIPSQLYNGRFFAKMLGPKNDTLVFMTDTGGGLFVLDSVLTAYGIPSEEREFDNQKGKIVQFTSLCNDEKFPKPNINGEQIMFSMPHGSPFLNFKTPEAGMLGQHWFKDQIWEFDYLKKKLTVGMPFHGSSTDSDVVKLGFVVDTFGKREINFPRVQIIVDSDTLDMLFDTGATVLLTDSARMQLQTSDKTRATSFIIGSIMDKWKKKHSDWRIITHADQFPIKNGGLPDMIEVPSIKIGGHTVGPVWFTSRPDKNFTEWMSQWMDKKIVGAVGGSAFQYFKITVDYPNALAKFEQ